MLPGPFDLRKRHTGLQQEVGECAEALALGIAAVKPASQRREDDPVLGIDGIDIAMNSGDVQEPPWPGFPLSPIIGAAPAGPS